MLVSAAHDHTRATSAPGPHATGRLLGWGGGPFGVDASGPVRTAVAAHRLLLGHDLVLAGLPVVVAQAGCQLLRLGPQLLCRGVLLLRVPGALGGLPLNLRGALLDLRALAAGPRDLLLGE